ncbi:hypothetical protein OAF63_01425 [Saprospiraceae bacterium]|jgi:hypothetical protein|nr:hypothetical protein [Saprospiraceae bacterium]
MSYFNSFLSKNQTLSEENYHRWLTIIGHIFFWIYIAFSLIFFKERLLNFDSAYYSFHILYHEDFFIIHGRTINYFTQWLPLLGIKMGGSLKTVLLLYSVSFMLVYYLAYNVIVHVIKNVEAGLFLALSLCLTMRYKFYTGISEITVTLAFVALLIAWLTKNPDRFKKIPKWVDWGIAFGIGMLIYTGHPLAIWLVCIFVGFDMLYNNRLKDWWYWGWLISIIGVYARRFFSIKEGSYEEGQLSRLENAKSMFENLADYEVYHIVKWYFQTEYILPLILFSIVVALIFWQKKWLPALYIMGVSFAHIILVLVHNSYIRGRIFYMIDGYLVYLGVIWAMAIFLVLLKSKWRKFSLTAMIIILSFSVDRVYKKHDYYTQRLDYLTKTMEMHATETQRKFILHPRYFNWAPMWVPSIMSLETLMLSSIDDPKNATVIHVADYQDDLEKLLKKRKLVIGSMPHVWHKGLNKNFFDLPEHEYLEIQEVAWPQAQK